MKIKKYVRISANKECKVCNMYSFWTHDFIHNYFRNSTNSNLRIDTNHTQIRTIILTNHNRFKLVSQQLNLIKLLQMARGRARRIRNQGRIFQQQIDALADRATAPSLFKGILTINGSEVSVINHLNTRIVSSDAIIYIPQPPIYPSPIEMYQPSPLSMYQPPIEMMPMYPPPAVVSQQPHVIQANITVVGSKTSSSDQCIFALIVLFGSLLIFPMLLLCFMCVKSAIYPKYDLSVDFYNLVGPFLRKQMQCRVLKLTIVDNGFDITKARALYQSLKGTQLTGLTLENKALHCNYLGTEADDFKNNVACLKSLPFTSTCSWGDMIV